MAVRKGRPRARRGKGERARAAPGETPEAAIIEAALALAAERGWSRVSLNAIAERAGVSLKTLHARFPCKEAIPCAFARRIDEAVLAARDPELAQEPARERLFAVLMARLDALKPYKAGVRALVRAACVDPVTLLGGALQLASSMAWMLEAAELSSAGPAGALRIKGLAAVHLATLRVFLADDSEDLAPSMAALDRNLRRAERLALLFEGRRSRRRGAEADEAAPG
ncbi:MAG TPA: TetR family transcriptional regulator [Alphaproteobacteria bacterium]|nr:TetR family transcriptional regulator [Alphaproteobacteria bacterium]